MDNRISTVSLRDLVNFDAKTVPLVVPSSFLLEFSAPELPVLAPHEQMVLALLARIISPRTILEFGTGQGFSSYLWAENTSDSARIVTLDLDPAAQRDYTAKILRGDEAVGRVYRESDQSEKVWQVLVRPGGPIPESLSSLKGNVDLIFVDGDHSYDGVAHDTELAFEFAHEDTVFLWHDFYRFPNYIAEGPERRGVYPYLNELADRGSLKLHHIAGTYLVAGCKNWSGKPKGQVFVPGAHGDGEARQRILRLGDF